MIRKTWTGLKGLLSGMGLTLKYFLSPRSIITQSYPENRETLKIPPRSRGRIELVRDPVTGEYTCNACGLCVKSCPNNSLVVERERDPVTKKVTLAKYEYHFDRCTLCGLCIEACRTDSVRLSPHFENAVFIRDELVLILNQEASAADPTPVPAVSGNAEPGRGGGVRGSADATPSVGAAPA
jgi:NADH-quinone oxidoreductase subunit I